MYTRVLKSELQHYLDYLGKTTVVFSVQNEARMHFTSHLYVCAGNDQKCLVILQWLRYHAIY